MIQDRADVYAVLLHRNHILYVSTWLDKNFHCSPVSPDLLGNTGNPHSLYLRSLLSGRRTHTGFLPRHIYLLSGLKLLDEPGVKRLHGPSPTIRGSEQSEHRQRSARDIATNSGFPTVENIQEGEIRSHRHFRAGIFVGHFCNAV